MIKATQQDTVKVHYTARLNDGEIFDQSPQDRPLMFILGRKEVIAGFEEAVEGMYQGESKTVTIPCEKAYGESNPELFEKIERNVISSEVELHEGGQLEVTNHDGSVFHVMVKEIRDGHVILDANHPLAGKELTFEIELLEVQKPETK